MAILINTFPEGFDWIPEQYDKRGIIKKYADRSFEVQDSDPGRQFLYRSVSTESTDSCLVDIWCGNGMDLQKYRELGFQNVSWIDASEWFVSEAKRNFWDRILIGRLENLSLSYAPESIDIVTSRFSLHYAKDIGWVFQEVSKILKPRGKFIFVVSHPDFDSLCRIDEYDIVHTSLFGGSVNISFPLHSMEEYLGEEFQRHFRLIQKMEYVGNERDIENPRQAGAPNALCIVCERWG